VTYGGILENLGFLKQYKPLIKWFWSNGLFENLDKRYYRLISKLEENDPTIHWDYFSSENPWENFSNLFNSKRAPEGSTFDRMCHFDLNSLLPALLQVEDRVSMAHGLESRVPLLDHPIVEFAGEIPSNIKFKNGKLKRLLLLAGKSWLPQRNYPTKKQNGIPPSSCSLDQR